MMDSVDSHERLATLETNVEHLQNALVRIEATLDELRPIVWKAAGAATASLIIVEVVLKVLH